MIFGDLYRTRQNCRKRCLSIVDDSWKMFFLILPVRFFSGPSKFYMYLCLYPLPKWSSQSTIVLIFIFKVIWKSETCGNSGNFHWKGYYDRFEWVSNTFRESQVFYKVYFLRWKSKIQYLLLLFDENHVFFWNFTFCQKQFTITKISTFANTLKNVFRTITPTLGVKIPYICQCFWCSKAPSTKMSTISLWDDHFSKGHEAKYM